MHTFMSRYAWDGVFGGELGAIISLDEVGIQVADGLTGVLDTTTSLSLCETSRDINSTYHQYLGTVYVCLHT